MKALVTGATGFIGYHLVRQLLAEGWSVRALIRRAGERGALIEELSSGYPGAFDVVDGDLNDPHLLTKAADGTDVVFHLAGTVIAVDKVGYFRTNFDGTVNLVNALLEAKAPRRKAAGGRQAPGSPPRLVFASSLAAGGPNPPGEPRSEGDPEAPITHYGRSKLAAEEYIQEQKQSLWSAILRPAAVYGPRDVGFASIFRSVSRGVRLGYLGRDMELSLVYVENVVQALIGLAGSNAPGGEVYYCADPQVMTVDAFQKAIAASLGKRTIRIPVPRLLALVVALLASLVQRVSRRPSFFNLQKVIEAIQPAWSCSAGKLRRELGQDAHIGLQEGLRRTISYYREEGLL